MKRQTARFRKAHLIRGAFYLLLLLASCTIPLAFSQRVIIQRAAPHLGPSQTRTFPRGCGLAWHVVPSPNASANTNILFGVGQSFSSIPLAVGSYYDENFTSRTLVEQWYQGTWTQVSSPNPGTTGNQLNAIAVGFLVDPWAVGFYTDDNFVAHTLVERLSGTWSVVPSPDNGTNGSYLQGVTALAPDDVWAVGYYIDDNLVNQTLAEHWDGQSWTIVASPNRGTDGSQLNGIAAVSANDIWAVGYSGQGTGVQTLIEHWNGSAWNIVDSPNPGTSGNYLQATAKITTASDVWAVGYYYEGGHPRTLIERWNGANWNIVPSPNVGTIGNSLFSVSGVYADNVWAVGAYSLNNQTGTLQTLIEHWDGNAWNVVASPNQGAADNILYGIAYGFGDEWSVGSYSDGINGRTLTLQYNDPCITPTPTPEPPPPTPTATPTATATTTATPTATVTATPTSTATASPTARPTPTVRPRPSPAPRP
jgi:hypothetical protein